MLFCNIASPNLDIGGECLWQHEPDEKQVSDTEGQGKKSWSLE